MFAIGLQTLQHSSEIHFSNVSCKEEKALHSGSSLINFINTVCIFSLYLRKLLHLTSFLMHEYFKQKLLNLKAALYLRLQYMQTGGIQRNIRSNWIQRGTKEHIQIRFDKVEAKLLCEVWRMEPNGIKHHRLRLAFWRQPDEYDVSFASFWLQFLIKKFLLFALTQSCSRNNFTSAICHDSHREKFNRKCTVSGACYEQTQP